MYICLGGAQGGSFILLAASCFLHSDAVTGFVILIVNHMSVS